MRGKDLPKWRAAPDDALESMHIYPINGAEHRSRSGDSAFSFRDANLRRGDRRRGPDPSRNPRTIAEELLAGAAPLVAGGTYLNMIVDEGEDMVKAPYRGQLRAAREGQSHLRPD